MVVHGCIEIHLNGCGGWIIVMGFRVLLITHYLIREILMETVLDVHASGVKIKNFIDANVIAMHLLQKKVHGEILVLVCIRRTICSSLSW
jgi:hypothetical protein